MSKKNFIRKIIEAAGGGSSTGWKSTADREKEAEVFEKVSKILNSVENRSQLNVAVKVVNNFIEQFEVKEKSPEYRYLKKIYTIKKLQHGRKSKWSNNDEDLSERQLIRRIMKEEIEDWISDTQSYDGIKFKVINNYTANLSDMENPTWTITDHGKDYVMVTSDSISQAVGKTEVEENFESGEWYQLPVKDESIEEEGSMWDNDENWGTDRSYWGNDPQWGSEGGDYGGGDSGGDDGGEDF